MRLAFTHLALGPHYPPADISAEVGRVAIAAARVDEMFVRLLEVMHCGPVQDRNFLLKRNSSRLRDDCKQQINSLFQGDIRSAAVAAVDSAYASLERRHEVMHTIWTLSGRDDMTTVSEMVAAAESADPESALQSLSTRDIDTTAWRTVHPKSGAPGPATVTGLENIRRDLEGAYRVVHEMTFSLASALYSGTPAGATWRYVHHYRPDKGEQWWECQPLEGDA